MKKIITLPRWTRITDLRFFSPMNASTKGRAMRVSFVSLPLTHETCLYSREKQKDTVCFVTFREPAYEACAFSIAWEREVKVSDSHLLIRGFSSFPSFFCLVFLVVPSTERSPQPLVLPVPAVVACKKIESNAAKSIRYRPNRTLCSRVSQNQNRRNHNGQ